MISFEVILNKIGCLGRYQIRILILVLWIAIPSGMHSIASVFYDAYIPYRCHVPPLDNQSLYPELSEDDILEMTSPTTPEGFDRCHRYGFNLSTCQPPTTDCVNKSADVIKCDHGHYFVTNQFISTTIKQWDLVCDRSILSVIATSIFFAGMWAGAIISGFVADRIGRRHTMLICAVGGLISGVMTSLSPWFPFFVAFRFTTAAFSHGGFLIMFVYVVEITGEQRVVTGIHTHSAFALGYTLNSLCSYFLRSWRGFYLIISLTPILSIFIHFLIPESPEWLFSNGREKEGKKLTEKFAEENRKILTKEDWKDAEIEENQLEENKSYSTKDLFQTPKMRLIIINMMFCWFAISTVYYGLALNAGNISEDIFLNNALNGILEISAYFILQFLMKSIYDRVGRRTILSSAFLVQGLSCLISTVIKEYANGNQQLETCSTVFAFLGKMVVSACFAIVYNYCAELFPSVVRGNALGISSMASRCGSIASPYIIFLQSSISWLPFTIFGVLSLLASFTCCFFPETKGCKLTQTIEEAENFFAGINNKDYSGCEVKKGNINKSFDEDPVTRL